MDEQQHREQMDVMADYTKDALIDAFAEFSGFIKDRKYDEAALSAHALAYGLSVFSRGLAAEALARRLADKRVDKPED